MLNYQRGGTEYLCIRMSRPSVHHLCCCCFSVLFLWLVVFCFVVVVCSLFPSSNVPDVFVPPPTPHPAPPQCFVVCSLFLSSNVPDVFVPPPPPPPTCFSQLYLCSFTYCEVLKSLSPPLISHTVSVDVQHYDYVLT